MDVSPALQPRDAPSGDVTATTLPPKATSAPVKGPMSMFLKAKTPPSTPVLPRGVAAPPKPKSANGKAPAVAPPKPKEVKSKAPQPSAVYGFVPMPENGAPFVDSSPSPEDAAKAIAKLLLDPELPAPKLIITSEIRDAQLKLLPVVLVSHGHATAHPKWHLLFTQTTDSCPLGGGRVFIASTAQGQGPTGVGDPFTPDQLKCLFGKLKTWTPGHVAAANPDIASMLWRAKATFKNLEWETVNVADLKAAIDKREQHIDVMPLVLPPAPANIVKDLETLPIDEYEDRESLKKALATWAAKGDYWSPPEGKWPSYPVAQHHPGAAKLGSRTDLAAAAQGIVRAPIAHSTLNQFPNLSELGVGLRDLSSLPRKATQPSPQQEEDDDDDEAAETAALCAPPKPKPVEKKPEKKSKPASSGGKQTKINPASFVHGAKSAMCSDDDSMSEGDPNDEEGEEAEDGFIASDDDVEAGDDVADQKARQKRASQKRKHNMTKNVVSDDDDDDDDGSGGDDVSSSDAAEMSGSGSDDGSEEGDDDEDDVLVKAKGDASDASGVDSDDEEEEAAAPRKRIQKGRDRRRKIVVPPKKKARVVEDDEASDDGAGAVPPSALLAQQRLSGERSLGSKPLPKMGSSGGKAPQLDRGLKARHEAHSNPRPPVSRSAAVDEPAPLFTPNKGKATDKGTPQPPGAPEGPTGRASRNDAWKFRKERIDTYKHIDRRITKLVDGPLSVASVGVKAKAGSIIGLSERGALKLVEKATACEQVFEELQDNRSIEHYNEVITNLLSLTSHLVTIVETADADEKTRKKHDNVNASLGTVAAQSLLKVVPQIEALQRVIGDANTQITQLVGTSAGMVSRLSVAAAKKDAAEGK